MSEKLAELVDFILLDWMPESLAKSLDGALAAGCSREKILEKTASFSGQDSFTYLATWAYLVRFGGGELPENWRPRLDPLIVKSCW